MVGCKKKFHDQNKKTIARGKPTATYGEEMVGSRERAGVRPRVCERLFYGGLDCASAGREDRERVKEIS